MIKAIKLKGTSMRPLFKEGDVVLFLPLNLSASDMGNKIRALRIGDCAVYWFEGKTLLHRVTKVANEGFWLQDDGQIAKEHFVEKKNIMGKVLSKNPFKKGVFGYLYFKAKNIFKCANFLQN